VYSSAYVGDEEARQTLLSKLEGRALGEPIQLRFTTGRRRLAWSRNCVAIGLAAGFLEPLESTGIHLVQRGLALLLQLFPDRRGCAAERDHYNRQIAFEYERTRDFLIVHYHQTAREGAFWSDCRRMQLPDSLRERLELFRGYGRIVRQQEELFTVQSWLFLLVGQNVRPAGYDPLADTLTLEEGRRALEDIRQVVARCAAVIPSHEAFIAQHCAALAQAPAIKPA
jgi:tryptophan halogenase